MTSTYQPAILRPVTAAGRFVTFSLTDVSDPTLALKRLAETRFDPRTVIGLGAPLFTRVRRALPGLRAFPTDLALFPATQGALWVFSSHLDSSSSFDKGRAFSALLGDAFAVTDEVEAFVYKKGRDLSGFEDGTENPKGKAAFRAAIVEGRGKGLDGGSFVAVQRWVHDLGALAAMSDDAQAAAVGRKRQGNRELPDAPPSAHVKRTAQESFDPPAFIVRKSMPYGGLRQHGLYFVAYGESLDRYERLLRRMAGRDDGIVDGLFTFSSAVTGGYYFCPPVTNGKLDLRAVLR